MFHTLEVKLLLVEIIFLLDIINFLINRKKISSSKMESNGLKLEILAKFIPMELLRSLVN